MTDTANFNSHGEPLDGTGKIKPVPFDAHEQATRGEHIPTEIDGPDIDPKSVQEYPKAIDHVQKPDAPEGHLEPIIAKDAEHEEQLKAAKEEQEEEPAKSA